MEQANKKYFISYFYTTKNDMGCGYTTVETDSKIKDMEKIQELASNIENSRGYEKVIVLNFQEL